MINAAAIASEQGQIKISCLKPASVPSLCTAFVNSLNWALVPDTVEYGEWKTGIRAEGACYTGYTFFRKISAALAGFLPGLMLTQIGYVPNAVQSDGTLAGLRQLIFIWPCSLAIAAALIMGFCYKLNEARFALIVAAISRRKTHRLQPVDDKNRVTPLRQPTDAES